MRQIQVTASTILETEVCPSCGMLFAMPARLRKQFRDDHSTFYCPSGHEQYYAGKSDAEKAKERADQLARQLDNARARATAAEDQAAAAERSKRALRAVNTRTRKRIANGLCPCCRRSFANLAEHMAGQHPDYAGSDQ